MNEYEIAPQVGSRGFPTEGARMGRGPPRKRGYLGETVGCPQIKMSLRLF